MKKKNLLTALIVYMICMSLPVSAQENNETNPETNHEHISYELMTSLNRSELEGLGEIDGPIYVFGHLSPDADTVCSAIGYAYILQKLGYDARPVTLGKINNETVYILNAAGIDQPPVLEDASGENVVLIDHSEYSQSAEGLSDANIIMIIDHHGDGSVTTGNQLIYDNRPLGATATIAWIRSLNYGVELDQQTSTVLLGAVLSDTRNLSSSTTTTADREAVRILADKAGLKDVDAFYSEMYKISISHEGMTNEEIFLSDMKLYETDGTTFAISVVNCYDQEEAAVIAEKMKAVMPDILSSEGADFGFVQISILHDDINMNYIVPSDEIAAELLNEAFGDEGTWDDISYIVDPGFSRKKVLVPRLTDVLSLHPKE